jgi:aminopeptidase
MFNEKIKVLAETIVNYSLEIKKGEKLLIEVKGQGTDEILKHLVQQTLSAGGVPFWNRHNEEISSLFLHNSNKDQIESWSNIHKLVMNDIDAYVSIRGADNVYELSSVPESNMSHYMKYYFEEVHSKIRVANKKWVVLRWPNYSMAQLAEIGTEEFSKFYFDTCTLDYKKLGESMNSLVDLMKKTDRVRLVNSDTDISFSIKNIPVMKCDGKRNIPDGEVYTAPVKDSINGYIKYNTPSPYQGKLFNDIKLQVKEGKIIDASCSGDNKALNAIFDTDIGSRYFGEFAIGVNPFINRPMKDTLFDEKIYGSFHFTPGSSYDEAPNGNKSAVHWDLVQIQTPSYGGGEIWFDDVLIRKDGEFQLESLYCLNKN